MAVTPNANTSALKAVLFEIISLFINQSTAIQNPTAANTSNRHHSHSLCQPKHTTPSSTTHLLTNPKSLSLKVYLLSSICEITIFSGLISRWAIPRECMIATALPICHNKLPTIDSFKSFYISP